MSVDCFLKVCVNLNTEKTNKKKLNIIHIISFIQLDKQVYEIEFIFAYNLIQITYQYNEFIPKINMGCNFL